MRSKLLYGVLGFFLVACSTTSGDEVQERALPILGERDVQYLTQDGIQVADTIYHYVPDFEYLNQDSVIIKSDMIKGKIWVADFFFTHCPTICPPMTSQMKRLNVNLSDLSDEVQFLSFSIDPDRDTPARLREYINEYGIEAKNWYFFTGDEDETHLLAKDFFSGAERNEEAEGGFGHTTYFVIVDREGLVRGIYDGTNTEQVDKLESDLRKLLEIEYDVSGK